MLTLSDPIIAVLDPFVSLFHVRTWHKVPVLLIGTMLTNGQRAVTAALRIMGLSDDRSFALYHHVLNRASCSPLAASQTLLSLLVDQLGRGNGPLVFGTDETLERRWVSMMWLGHVPWAGRHWALPFLTVLAPSERFHQQQGRRHKKVTDWARQMIIHLRHWLPNRYLVIVADGGYAALDILHSCQSLPNPVTMITRMRLDAALYAPAPPRQPGQMGRPRLKGPRLPKLRELLDTASVSWTSTQLDWYDGTTRTLELASQTTVWYHSGKPPVPIRWVLIQDPRDELDTQALLCTDQTADPAQIVEWFVLRWQLEVTFQEVRAHLGVETQRQWSDKAIARTTPLLLGLFSWITLAANSLQREQSITQRTAAWYPNSVPTFSDAMALVGRNLWMAAYSFSMSPSRTALQKAPQECCTRLITHLTAAA